jgi:hypothetical protein
VSIDCIYPDYDATCTPGLVGPGHAVQFAIQVVWASSDLTLFPAGYTPGGFGDPGAVTAAAFEAHIPGSTIIVSTSGVTGINTSMGGPHTTAATSEDGGGSLSTGAKAGIGIGVAIAILAILAGSLLIVRRRRKYMKPTKSDGRSNRDNYGTDADKEVVAATTSFQSGHYYCGELEGQSSRTELPDFQVRRLHELPHDLAKSPHPHQTTPLSFVNTSPTPGVASGSDMSATTFGPVGSHLDNVQDLSTSSREQPAPGSPGHQADPTISYPVTVEDVELRYLEDEERRIRERKQEILATRRAA